MKIRTAKKSARAGFALILVMIAIIALTTLVASFTLSMSTEVRLARNSDYDQEMEWMGRSGVELARFALANKCSEQQQIDALNQFWAGGTSPCSNSTPQFSLTDFAIGSGKISVHIEDMERKWDINLVASPRAPQLEVLQRAIMLVGVTDEGLAQTIQDSILDWCNPSTVSGLSHASGDYYMHLNPPYYCKNGQIDDLTELLLIKGVTSEIYWGSNATNHPVSAYQQHGGGGYDQATSRSGGVFNKDEPVYPHGLVEFFSPLGRKLNINTASALALQLIPGVDENFVERKLQERAGPDGVDGTDDDAPFQNIGEFLSGMPGGGMAGGPPGAYPGAGGIPGAPPGAYPGGVPPGGPNGQPGQPGTPGAPPPGPMGPAAYIDVRSYVFKVKVDAEINNYKRTFYGIVSRDGSGKQMNCVKFYWE